MLPAAPGSASPLEGRSRDQASADPLGLYLRPSDARGLEERILRAFGFAARFLRGDEARERVEYGRKNAARGLEGPPHWHFESADEGMAVAILPIEMPPGAALALQVGPFWHGEASKQGGGLRDPEDGELRLIEELVLGQLERRRLEAALERRERSLAATVAPRERRADLTGLVRLALEVSGGEGAAFLSATGGDSPTLVGTLQLQDEDYQAESGTYPIARVHGQGAPLHLGPEDGVPERYLVPVGPPGGTLGVLIIRASEGSRLRPLERRLVDGVAEQIFRHVDQVEGERRSQHRISHLETLNSIEERIHGTLDLVDVVETALDLCVDHLGGRAASLLLLGDGSRDLHVREATGRYRVVSKFPTDVDRDTWDRLCGSAKPQRLHPDPLAGNRSGYFPTGCKEAVGCLLGPVHRPIGVLLVGLDRPASPRDLETIHLVALPLSRALKNAILFEKGERQIAELSLINEMGKALNSSLDLDDVLHYIVDMIASILEADRGSLMLLDREANELFIEVHTGLSDKGRRMRLPVGQGIAGAVAASQTAVLSRNTATDKRYQVDHTGPIPSLTLISAPITCRGKLLGVLNFEKPLERSEPFHADDLELLTTLASQAGIAIENAGLYNDLVQVYFDTIKSLASALEAKDIYTHGHSRRVAKDAVRMARRLGLGKKQLEMIRHGALLHDIGKIGIRDSILFKPGPLDPEERTHIQSHPMLGANIMASFDVLKEVRDIIKHHHERWDGAGFPDRLRGKEISLGARIVCIADSFDAMITSRPYREGMPIPKALNILRAEKGKQFDPDLVDIFLEVIHSMHPALKVAGA